MITIRPVRRAALVVTVLGAFAQVALAQHASGPDPAKRTAILRLLAAQKTDSVFLAGLDQALASQPADPNVPAGFMEAFRDRARRDVQVFIDRLVPIFDSVYTMDDINGLLAFYQTPVGRRMTEAQPRLLASVQAISEAWGMELAGQVLVDLARQPRGAAPASTKPED